VLAGYTNAGKSTLFSALSRSHATAESRMFSTLDPQVRIVRLPGGGRLLLSDTVGFIQDLPEDLRVAFRATLEEIADADGILHVVDASHQEASARMAAVRNELSMLGAGAIPAITVMNKSDLAGSRGPSARWEPDSGALARDGNPREGSTVAISATTGSGLENLKTELERLLRAVFWQRLSWGDPTPRLRSELAALGVAVTGTGSGDLSLEAWLSPAQAAAARKVQQPDAVASGRAGS